MCRVYADDEGDALCLIAAQNVNKSEIDSIDDEYIYQSRVQNVDEIESELDFIDEYDQNLEYTQRWRVSDYEDNFDVVDLVSDVDSYEEEINSFSGIHVENEKSVKETNSNEVVPAISNEIDSPENELKIVSQVISISSSSEIEFFQCSNNNWFVPENHKSNTSSQEMENAQVQKEKYVTPSKEVENVEQEKELADASAKEKEDSVSINSYTNEQRRRSSQGM